MAVRSPDLVVAGDAASSSAARLADVAGWLTRASDQPSRRRLVLEFGRLAVGAGSCQESPGRGRTTAAGDFRYDVLLAGLAEWLTAQDGQPAPE